MTVIGRPVRLPKLAFLTAWELQGLGTPHPVIGINDLYMTDNFRAKVLRRTLTRLASLGLATTGGLHPHLRNTLAAITGAEREFYAWSNFRNGDSGAILVAALGNDAIRLITDGTSIHLDPIDADRLAEHFAETLPDVPSARITPIATTRAEFNGERDDIHSDPLAEPVANQQQINTLRELMQTRRDAVHQTYVSVRDRQGQRHRSQPLSVFDLTHHGRVLAFLNTGQDRHDVINLIPGTTAMLISTLNATHNGLRI